MTPNYGVNHPLPSVAFPPMGGVKQRCLGRNGAHQRSEFTLMKCVSVGP